MADNGGVDGTETKRPDQADSAIPASARSEGWASGERLVLFTDAVTAISITLLILPLVDLVPEVASAHEGASKVITDHVNQIWSFVLSFAVIANIWGEHHRAFSSVERVTRPLTMWNMGWLLSVVVLPLPTEMIGAFGRDRFVAAFYYGTVLATMVCRLGMLGVLKNAPGLLEEDGRVAGRRIEDVYTDSWANVIALVVAFAVALAVPTLQYYSLLLLLLPGRLRLRGRRTAR
jgi:uncharacterized membrane protein